MTSKPTEEGVAASTAADSPTFSPSVLARYECFNFSELHKDKTGANNDITHGERDGSKDDCKDEAQKYESKSGAKILMVEWQEDEATRNIKGRWSVSWEGIPSDRDTRVAREELDSLEPSLAVQTDAEITSSAVLNSRSEVHRRYYLLRGQHRTVPTTIEITLNPFNSAASPVIWRTVPRPFLEMKEKDREAEQKQGKVLYTRWIMAKLDNLQNEVEKEAEMNSEGIALHMCLKELEDFAQEFCVEELLRTTIESQTAKPNTVAFKGATSSGKRSMLQIRPVDHMEVPQSHTSPVTPGGSRLSEKFKGLKLHTAGSDELIAAPLHGIKVQQWVKSNESEPRQQAYSVPTTGVASIGAMLAPGFQAPASAPGPGREEDETDLFALPLSPRSPEMSKSPFSFASEDTRRYAAVQNVA